MNSFHEVRFPDAIAYGATSGPEYLTDIVILQSSGVTVDHTTGKVTFTAAPATGVLITADCEFDVPVRFDTDRLAIRIQSHELFVWDQIPLIEIRL